MKVLVTGAAGFVGSLVVDRLLAEGHQVVGVDNLSTGRHAFLADAERHARFTLCVADLNDSLVWPAHLQGCDLVMHFAANADVRYGSLDTLRDLRDNLLATRSVLEAMRLAGVRKLMFSSTGSVYGDAATIPTPEDAPMPVQTSLYGASKLAAEGFIQAFCEYYGMQAWIFRFVSLVGRRYQHGHIYDFVRQLRHDPTRLRILGDGRQRKSYLDVEDCIEAMMLALRAADRPVNIFNLGTDEYCTVADSAGWIAAAMGAAPRFEFTGGVRGWPGDNPFLFLATDRIRGLGWRPRLTIRQGVEATVAFLRANAWLFDTDPRAALAVPAP